MEGDTFEGLEAMIENLPTSGPGYLYVLYGEGTPYIKIGKATNVSARMQDLQVGCPHRLHLLFSIFCQDALALENLMHDHFAPHHLHGDWFTLPSDIPTVLDLLAFLYNHSQRQAIVEKGTAIVLDYEDANTRILEILEEGEAFSIEQLRIRLGMNESSYGLLKKKLYDLFHKGKIGKSGRGLYRMRKTGFSE